MKKVTRYIVTGGLFLLCMGIGMWCGRQYRLQHSLAEKVLRFHVLANSDAAEDQNLKLEVRDAIGSYMQEKMQNVKSKEECEALVVAELEEIEQVAGKIVKDSGFPYEVRAELTECKFPVKSYGSYTFPAGSYDALRVTIGEGDGQNWWCVMYPNMCFENSMYEVTDQKSEENLRAVLDKEEYEAVLNSGNYEVRFWFMDIFK